MLGVGPERLKGLLEKRGGVSFNSINPHALMT